MYYVFVDLQGVVDVSTLLGDAEYRRLRQAILDELNRIHRKRLTRRPRTTAVSTIDDVTTEPAVVATTTTTAAKTTAEETTTVPEAVVTTEETVVPVRLLRSRAETRSPAVARIADRTGCKLP